jgi:hypothetical protein
MYLFNHVFLLIGM